MKPKIVAMKFEDYGFKYFHEGYIQVHEYQNIKYENHGHTIYTVSVRELEIMAFGC